MSKGILAIVVLVVLVAIAGFSPVFGGLGETVRNIVFGLATVGFVGGLIWSLFLKPVEPDTRRAPDEAVERLEPPS